MKCQCNTIISPPSPVQKVNVPFKCNCVFFCMLKLPVSFLQSKGPVHITPTDVQEKYLSLIREFFDKGKISELQIQLNLLMCLY